MEIETVDGRWIKSRFILTTYIDNSKCISCKLYNGDVHGLFIAELVSKATLDALVNFIVTKRPTTKMLSQEDIHKYMNQAVML